MPRTYSPSDNRRRRTSLILFLGLTCLIALPNGLPDILQPTAHAATTFNVNSTGDAADNNTGDGVCNDGSGNCTLRAAVQQANATAGTDTININAVGNINLTGALPNLATNMTISGPGSGLLTVRRDTGGDYRIFTVDGGVGVTISGLTVANGKAAEGVAGVNAGGNGGGIANMGTLTMTGVTVNGNSTGRSTSGAGSAGGGVYNAGTLTMTDCVVSGNSTGSGGDAGAGGGIANEGPMTLTDVVVSGNTTGEAMSSGGNGGNGGGLSNQSAAATLTRVRVINNTTGGCGSVPGAGGHGGGLYLRFNTVTLRDSTVSGNSTGTCANGSPGYGGGVETFATLIVSGSTLSGNSGLAGGAILNRLTLSLTNTTVSGNHFIDSGSAINNDGPTLTLTNCTVAANDAVGVTNTGGGSAVVRNTIIAANGSGGNVDTLGAFTSQGHNIVGAPSPGMGTPGFDASGDQAGSPASPLDAKLGPLADNGGPTLTHAPLAGSPALDAGDNTRAKDFAGNTLATDQRGAGRFAGPGTVPTVDVGAVEFNQFMEDVADKGTNEDTPLSFTFFTGDQTVSSLTVTSDDQTLLPNANINVSASGTVRTIQLTPASNRSGTANITVHLTGSNEGTVSQTFALTVAPVNDAPSFTKGADQTVAEDAGPQTVVNWATGLSAGPFESSQALSSLVTANSNAALFSSAPAVSPSGTLTYTPAANANGSATIIIVVKDDGGTANGGQDTSAPQTFVINVTAVNDPPVAVDRAQTLNEDASTVVQFGAGDPEGDSITFAVVTGPSHGTLTDAGTTRTYTPAADYNGSDSFTYKAVDASGAESAPATVSLTINAVNDAPVNSVPAAQVTNTNTPLVFSAANSNAVTVSDKDAGTDPVRVTLSTSSGRLTLGSTAGLTFSNGDGLDDASFTFTAPMLAANVALDGLTYTPNTSFNNGPTSVTITTNDQGFNGSGGARTDTDNISIQVRSGGLFRWANSQTNTPEGSGTIIGAVVQRTGTAFGAASVKFATTGGTANGGASCDTPGVDYVSTSGTLNWADGDGSSKPVAITICEDSVHEPFDYVFMTLSDAGGSGTISTPNTTQLFIGDNDPVGGIIELAQSSYTVAEGAGRLAVTVKRTSDTTKAASVDYATDDGSIPSVSVPCASTTGMALDRCDFTRAQGTVSFAPGESEKTFDVLISDDSYVEGTETALIRLSNPGGEATLGSRTVATLEITDDAQESSSNPIDDTSKFVRQHYHDFLNREPDAPGLAFWTQEIEQCGSDARCREVKRINVSAAFFLSIESQQTGYLVYRLDKVAFGNLAGKPVPLTISEFLADTQSIGRGLVVGATGWEQQLESNKRAFVNAFVARSRFTGRYPAATTPEQYVDSLNVNAGGVLSQEERDSLVAGLKGGAKNRAEVLRAVAEHPSVVRRESNQAFVLMQFFGYLRRDPDSAPDSDFAGYSFWLGKLNEFNGDYIKAEMVKAFLDSIEYRKRFGQ
jgi:CSLREA domain-containing protein